MTATVHTVRLIFVVTSVAFASGCAADKDSAKGQSPISMAPALGSAPREKPKAVPLPELPDGAGAIDPEAPAELTPTSSGLYYRVLRKGAGKKPTSRNTVVAHYRGWLDDGSQFDSSYDKGQPAEFPLDQVVKGWTEGLQLVGEGGMIELEIPSYLGYGAQGRPGIPPAATLHFIVELKEVR